VLELEQLINQLDNQNLNMSSADGAALNLDNISFKGAEIADIMGLGAELEKHENEQAKQAAENTLNFSFNKEASL
jgi:hypothetical protein